MHHNLSTKNPAPPGDAGSETPADDRVTYWYRCLLLALLGVNVAAAATVGVGAIAISGSDSGRRTAGIVAPSWPVLWSASPSPGYAA